MAFDIKAAQESPMYISAASQALRPWGGSTDGHQMLQSRKELPGVCTMPAEEADLCNLSAQTRELVRRECSLPPHYNAAHDGAQQQCGNNCVSTISVEDADLCNLSSQTRELMRHSTA